MIETGQGFVQYIVLSLVYFETALIYHIIDKLTKQTKRHFTKYTHFFLLLSIFLISILITDMIRDSVRSVSSFVRSFVTLHFKRMQMEMWNLDDQRENP